ncbi:CLUMA_CG012930, isoform A [Clunio marinus]|uniref:CLUMA_CG012930, isoform A n=1 Tax=Clunio marinus TaxID=568069 RepID=A0A1J1IIM1_9DIPT|nr:CLUMA_CG012930, isoform A [Clunio marinus]
MEGDDCSIGLPGAPLPNSICGDGLYCSLKNGNYFPTCEPMLETSECFRMRREFDNNLGKGSIGHLQQAPLCDGDGDFSPLICIPGQTCFCVNKRGERIFGDGLYRKNIHQIMQCECSRLNDKLKELVEQSFPFFSTRCQSDGSFDPVQCFGDLCVCVDERSGSPTSDTKNLTVGLSELPCYDEKIHHDEFNYARPCENIKLGLINMIFEVEREGFIDVEVLVDICDLDGSYAPVQKNDLSLFCADKNGERIEEFSVSKDSPDADSMNCKCARARKLLTDNNYLEIPECCSNGNYKKLACRRGFCFCVDEDGKQVSVEVIDIHKTKLPCSENECN